MGYARSNTPSIFGKALAVPYRLWYTLYHLPTPGSAGPARPTANAHQKRWFSGRFARTRSILARKISVKTAKGLDF